MTVDFFTLIALGMVGYVAYRALQASRRGEAPGRAAARAAAEALPPAVAVGVGLVLLYVAVALLLAFLLVAVLAFAFTAPFAVLDAAFSGGSSEWHLGWFAVPPEAYVLFLLGLLLVLGALVWVATVALRRARAVPAAAASPPPVPPPRVPPPPTPARTPSPAATAARRRPRPLRAPGR